MPIDVPGSFLPTLALIPVSLFNKISTSTSSLTYPPKLHSRLTMSLKGQVALVTGGAKNLGAQIALELAPLGVDLALHYNSPKTKEEALKLEAKFKREFPSTKVVFYPADLTTAAAVDKLFADVLEDFGRIDIVVNTIGMVLKKPISEVSEEEYDKMFAYVYSSWVD